ncbi:Oidioi.mRNA.OKI2018_I69.PAR.g8713.t1.cds [Oikopleura dioica]|uniref:Oidioi.mRNA.OKI2018_I69.PAR.g8713.t1.cds n=1 Tax=Oikopleura dioica TaxID=34765 RepID=A0ABN7RHB3_OIKDI|nr:Oidioi.mRNA.OKI2018_I69.PAR.g8713.t1.cds [Oikopleura dioica]
MDNFDFSLAIFVGIESFLSLIIVVGNILVALALTRMLGPGRLRRKSSHELILSLAAADLCVGLISIPLTVAARIGFFSTVIACSGALASIQVPHFASLFGLVFISIERFLTVSNSSSRSRLANKMFIGSTWGCSCILSVLPLLVKLAKGEDEAVETCSFGTATPRWYSILCLAIFILCILIISTFYFRMSRVAIAAQKKIRARRSTIIFPNINAAPKRSFSMPDVSRLNYQVIHSSKADMILHPSCDLESGSQETLSSGYCSQGSTGSGCEESISGDSQKTSSNFQVMKNKILAVSNKSLHMIHKFQTKRDALTVSEKAGEVMILLVATIFLTQVGFFLAPFLTTFAASPIISMIGTTLLQINSSLNPLLYSMRVKPVRTSLMNLFKRRESAQFYL